MQTGATFSAVAQLQLAWGQHRPAPLGIAPSGTANQNVVWDSIRRLGFPLPRTWPQTLETRSIRPLPLSASRSLGKAKAPFFEDTSGAGPSVLRPTRRWCYL